MLRYIVPDTSAIAAALYRETYSAQSEPLLRAIRKGNVEAVMPSSGFTEFFNVSRKKLVSSANSPALAAADVEAVVSDFLTLPILWWGIDSLAPAAWRFHRDHGLETGDAFFVEVARQWDAELWTIDDQFYQKAGVIYPRTFDLRVTPFA